MEVTTRRARTAAIGVAATVLLIAIVCCTLAAPPQAQAARATKASGGAEVHVLKVGKTYKKYGSILKPVGEPYASANSRLGE